MHGTTESNAGWSRADIIYFGSSSNAGFFNLVSMITLSRRI